MNTLSLRSGLAARAGLIALAVALLTASAKITVPFWPVPMTMQVAAVMLIGALGGAAFAGQSMMAYLAAGAAGLPVFAGTPAKGIGLAYMTGPTGGYLLGFLLAALLVGWAVDRFGRRAVWAAMPVALAVIYACGLAWLARFVPSEKLLAAGMLPFLPGDLIKVAVAAFAASAILPSRGNTADNDHKGDPDA